MKSNGYSLARDSNMELARVVAMLFVLITHADFLSLGWPTQSDSINAPWATMFKVFIEAVSCVCVNMFVLISGWFGIRPSIKKGVKLLATALFYSIIIFVFLVLINGSDTVDRESIKNALLLSTGYWFIKSYLLLLILTPALNRLVEGADRFEFRIVLLAMLTFQTVFGWGNATFDYHHGFSTLLFVFLYLLGRYVRLYPLRFFEKKSDCIMVYLVITILLTLFTYAATRYDLIPSSLVWYSFNYLNPFVILSALSLMLFFTKLQNKSRAINWIASSSLAVYCIHANDAVLPLYTDMVIYLNESSTMPVLLISVFILSVFALSILIDKIRVLLFRICSIG